MSAKPNQHQTDIGQPLLVKDVEGVNEHASKFYIDEQPHLKAKKSYEDSPLLSKKSVERISPSKMDNEVLRFRFVICKVQCGLTTCGHNDTFSNHITYDHDRI